MTAREVAMGHIFRCIQLVTVAAICALEYSQILADGGAIQPDRSLTPEQVVTIQLEALQHNDEPHPDAGIEQTWTLAHPDNKRATGPLARFSGMLKSPAFRPMLNHHAHSIEVARRNAAEVTFIVMVETRAARAIGYEWTVEKVRAGKDAGCWMTTIVSPPVALGETI